MIDYTNTMMMMMVLGCFLRRGCTGCVQEMGWDDVSVGFTFTVTSIFDNIDGCYGIIIIIINSIIIGFSFGVVWISI